MQEIVYMWLAFRLPRGYVLSGHLVYWLSFRINLRSRTQMPHLMSFSPCFPTGFYSTLEAIQNSCKMLLIFVIF